MLLITGSDGQLGTCLRAVLPGALAAGSAALDIADAAAVRDFVERNRVDVIVNCAAYTAVDKAEDEPEAAERVNAIGPANLARSGAAVVHISTDYVFDGTSRIPYAEEMPTNPRSVYGASKLRGEQAVLGQAESAAVIRTSWLYSPYGNNFVKTMLRLGSERERITVVADQTGCPTSCFDLAGAIAAMLPRLRSGTRAVYHYANGGACTWCEFAAEIMRLAGLGCEVVPIGSADYPARAERPAYSVLDTRKFREAFGVPIPHWKESLKECLTRF